jgi:hypothetical protein
MGDGPVYLDCHDFERAATSLAAILGVSREALIDAVGGYDAAGEDDPREDPAVARPRAVLAALGHRLAPRAGGVYFFHGTRAIDPRSFEHDGLRPLSAAVNEIWRSLFELVDGDMSASEWDAFRRLVEHDGGGDDGSTYRDKTRHEIHDGPHAELLREIYLDPPGCVHDYLRCPEIVQDISRCLESEVGIDLEDRFCRATRPYIVKFGDTDVPADALPAAINYLAARLRGDAIPPFAGGGYVGRGRGIPAADIVEVELVDR